MKRVLVSSIIILIILSLGIGMIYGLVTPYAKKKNKLPEERIRDLVSSKKPFLIDFYADWCPPCIAMKPVLEKLEKKYKGRVEIVRVDVDAPENNSLVIKYKIMSIPTFIFINSKGEVSKVIIGYRDMEVMENEFRKLLQKDKGSK